MTKPTLLKPAVGLLAGIGFTLQAYAGIPVIDGANVALNQVTSIESIAQTAKQIEEYATQMNQYRTQLDQYENMVKNTVAPAAYIWDEANSTINKLMHAQDMLDYYTNQAGSFESYLDKFQDTNYYRSSPCFGSGGCTAADEAALQKQQELASTSQKNANDGLFKSIKQQQDNLKSDARQLERLQQAATTADGQVKAIQYANQLSSQQANQLLQLRMLMLAQQTAEANRHAAELDERARGEAQNRRLTEWTFKKSPKDDF
ncbi:P-type conjugative transfer protein TrbJ [Pseudomonas sp. S60]|uniref:P-type conjugative transfer protein TrbJ n=1 Tax=unclassified Pseudomonas TaxID=196821 RepID=UPI00191477EC|nr:MULTISPECIES: P-type conjugative transfer protein TrbJ [unclassified Pseudomonas]MBK5005757.1 P-type conjugative transfer protein TrbJ [Pseudomonas sp. S32]MBK5010202.1 P-type conjugative transfer protein TrbJ [Pseudomonas sp. S60]